MNEKLMPLSAGRAEDAAVQLEQDCVGIVQEEIGMHEQMATTFAQALVRELRRKFGSRELYIPPPNRSERDTSIRRKFGGANLDELMRQHGLSRTRIYEIVGNRPSRSLVNSGDATRHRVRR